MTRSSTFVRILTTVALAIADAITVQAEAGGISTAAVRLARPNSKPALQCDGGGDADDHLTGSPSSVSGPSGRRPPFPGPAAPR
jgi:hypothetical protein